MVEMLQVKTPRGGVKNWRKLGVEEVYGLKQNGM